jgi:hypothetical protein
LFPTATLPKPIVLGFGTSSEAEIPVPDNGIFTAELEASEVIVIVPVIAPVACGANVTVNLVLSEALSVSGVVMPLSRNPAPLTETCEMSTLELPVLVTVTYRGC